MRFWIFAPKIQLRGGLLFWVPALSKPGFVRYDEGDLRDFDLVKQLSRAGFTLAQMKDLVFGQGSFTYLPQATCSCVEGLTYMALNECCEQVL